MSQFTKESNHCQFPSGQITLVQTKFPYIKNVRLILFDKPILIGKIDLAGEGTFICNRNERHIFHKDNSIGITYQLLTDNTIPFQWINVNLSRSGIAQKLVTSRKYFLRFGHPLKFSNKGFELQYFLPIEQFGLNKAREFENLETSSVLRKVKDELSLFGDNYAIAI